MATALEITGKTTSYHSVNWERVCYLIHASRALDNLESGTLLKQKKLFYQFSAIGHDLSQILLGQFINHPHDAVNGYYRSRPLMLTLGLTLEDALAGPLMRQGSMSEGRDIGVVFNLPNLNRPCALPMCGGVGAQYTPIAGWAQAMQYYHSVLNQQQYAGAIAVAHGGDASTATNGFWAALNIATTLKLPMLFFIEDNGYGISVTSDKQTPGRNIAANLSSFKNLHIVQGDGTDPDNALQSISDAVNHVRSWQGPALLRLQVPRLTGHSAQDTQAYKSKEQIEHEKRHDPLPKLKEFIALELGNESIWTKAEEKANSDVTKALEQVESRGTPDPKNITQFVFYDDSSNDPIQTQGGLRAYGHVFPESNEVSTPEPQRMGMLAAIRRTLDVELASNPKLLVFGEDIADKGGVHGATLGLAEKYGDGRVFDTSLSEEGIIGRAVGMAQAGLMPVPEIQFRKYADPAEEQLNDCGTMRWRTANRFAAPMVVRMPGGFFKCGDPWHSQSGEVKWAHAVGWQLAMPSNAEDAVGLLRFAMRSNNPTIFFEHRNLLDDASARRPYPGDDFVVPFGKASLVTEGSDLTIVSWGAMVTRCQQALTDKVISADLIDLRTLMPWDKETVLKSVAKTHRILIVHEDNITAGFGAEIAARVSDEAFFDLDAPVKRLAMPDVPSPHSPLLLDAVVPNATDIASAIADLLEV
ncbi:MAG: transketolase C-terminal domain-containing protein [Pseudomonadota bacterium]